MSKEKILNDDWRILKFSECIEQLNTGLNPRKNFTLGKGKIKYITAKNLTKSGTIDFSKCDFIDEEAKKIINKRSDIKVGDILFSSRAPIGHCHLIKEEPDFFDIGESIFSIRVNQEIVLPEYLCLYLSSDYFVKMATQNTTGSIIMEIRVSNLMDTSIIVPPKHVQKCIANCLNTIDRKIELNDKINENLQQMAKMIYDYWFLQFDFPDESGKPYKSSGGKMAWNEELKKEVPEGWVVKRLSNVGQLLMGQSPKSESYNENGEGFPLINGAVELQKDKVYITKYTNVPTRICKKDDLIFCIRATIGNLRFAEQEYCLGRGVAALTPNKKEYTEYLYHVINNILDVYGKTLTGSIIVGITKDDLAEKNIVCPTDDILEKFSEIVYPMLTKIRINEKENQEIASLRDFLLPLLMNGQVGFKN